MTVDLGGQWVGSSQANMLSLLNELQIPTYRQFTAGKKVLQLNDGHCHVYRLVLLQMLRLSTRLLWSSISVEWAADRVQRDLVQASPNAALLNEHSAADWIRPYGKVAEQVFRLVWRSITGCELEAMSALYILWFIKSAGTFTNLIEMEFPGAQELRIHGGAGAVTNALRAAIGPEHISLGQVVRSVEQDAEGVRLVTEQNLRVQCARAVLAAPPRQAVEISFRPPLPAERCNVMKDLIVGHYCKVVVLYRRAFWRERGFSGECASSAGPLCTVCDTQHPCGQPGLVAFLGGEQGRRWSLKDAATRRGMVLQHLAQLFGCDDAYEPFEYHEKIWDEEPFVGGCPVATCVPGSNAGLNLLVLRAPHLRVHFAGTESSSQWFGYMDGAVQAALRAAAEVVEHLRPDQQHAVRLVQRPSVHADTFGKKIGRVAGWVAVSTAVVAGVYWGAKQGRTSSYS
eukprot:m.11959 g.11959  ORF g.11959 m.11959 type:complete len:456 (-) comp6657_c0_seq1:6-1373(-)